MSDKLVKWLQQQIRHREWSVRETARHAALSHTAIHNALSGHVSPSMDTYKGLSRAFDTPLENILRLAGELPPPLDEQRARNPTLDEGIRILTEFPPGDLAAAVRVLRGLRLTAGTAEEAARAPESEQMFYSSRPALQSLPQQERQVYYEALKTLTQLSEDEDLAWAAEWFRRANEAREQDEETRNRGNEVTGTDDESELPLRADGQVSGHIRGNESATQGDRAGGIDGVGSTD